jgi:sulfite reductase (NADPH) flavoprotein alpha-component
VDGCDVLDVLRLFPTVKPNPAAFVAVLSPLRPRLYSISSSQTAHPHAVHLSVGRVSWEHNGRTRKGVASTMFADRIAPGQKVAIFVQKSHGFTVPSDDAAPMIMVGPGTGIAPFRAFLQEREARGATGANWLFFGDRSERSDFLYRDQLEAWRSSGHLTRLDLAFSRDSDAKVYVQDHMRQHGKELWEWLERGASFFVCGDAKRMAVDVDRALRDIVAEHGGMTLEAAGKYVEQLWKSGRYRRDVY